MAVTRLVSPSGASVQPVGATGTYTLAVPLTPGLYKITTDTVQNLSNTQLYFATADGFRFGAAVRGGQGYVAIPLTVTQVTFTTGTFPLLVGFEKFLSYSLIAAPVASLEWLSEADMSTTSDFNKAKVSWTPPSGATGIGYYQMDGTFTDITGQSSPYTFTLSGSSGSPARFDGGSTRKILLAAKDANGVWGLGDYLETPPYPWYIFTSSDTYEPPAGSTTADVLVVAGNGSGSPTSNVNHNTASAGGGGGGVFLGNAVATNGPVAVTVGANGGYNPYAPIQGGSSQFGNVIDCGGGGQGAGWIATNVNAAGQTYSNNFRALGAVGNSASGGDGGLIKDGFPGNPGEGASQSGQTGVTAFGIEWGRGGNGSPGRAQWAGAGGPGSIVIVRPN